MAAPATTITHTRGSSLADRVPAAGLVILAILGFQLGAVVAKPAIEDVGPLHPVFIRILLGAIFLLAWKRPYAAIGRREFALICATGVTMVINNLVMYAAIERIPVGIAVAIGFWGPMVLALHGSRRPLDVVWVALAVAGILLFTPLADASFDTTGLLFAVVAGAGFGATLVFASRLGHAIGPIPAAGMAMLFGSIVLAPVSIAGGLSDAFSVEFVWRMLIVGVSINLFGFAAEYTALTRVRPGLYAILISTEPAVGAILGLVILGEHIGWLGAAGIGAVAAASIGASRTHTQARKREGAEARS
jgi:inner membrane transporter RhtA